MCCILIIIGRHIMYVNVKFKSILNLFLCIYREVQVYPLAPPPAGAHLIEVKILISLSHREKASQIN